MPISPKQVGLVKAAQKRSGLEDPEYRLLLRNVAKVDSSKDLSQIGFEDVMATLEDVAESDNYYWREIVESRGDRCTSRAAFLIKQLAGQPGGDRYGNLATLCHAHSEGRVMIPDKLTPAEARKLIEMLKAVVGREHPPTSPPSSCTSPAAPRHLFPNSPPATSANQLARERGGKIRKLNELLGGDWKTLYAHCQTHGGDARCKNPEALPPQAAQHCIGLLVAQLGVEAARAAGIDDPPYEPSRPTSTPSRGYAAQAWVPPSERAKDTRTAAEKARDFEDVPF